MPPSLWNATNSSPSYPAAEREAWKIRKNKYRLYIYIGMEFMFNNERVVWVYMCSGGMSVDCVGLVHLQNTQDSHIQSTCYYSNSLKPQITFHRAQRMAVCNHRDRREQQHIYSDTQGDISSCDFRSLADIFLPFSQSKFDAPCRVPHRDT